MLSIQSKIDFLQTLDQLKNLVLEWHNLEDIPANHTKKSRLWRQIITEFSPFMYLFPKYRFAASEDSCSDFYIFAMNRLDYILQKAGSAPGHFSFYILKSFKFLYFQFVRDKQRELQQQPVEFQENEIRETAEYHSQNVYSGEVWENFIYQNQISIPASESESFIFSQTTATSSVTYEKIHEIMATLTGVEKATICLYYGFPLQSQDVCKIFDKSESDALGKYLTILRDLQMKKEQDAKNRQKILEKLQYFKVKHNRTGLSERDSSERERLIREYHSFTPDYTLREIASFLGLSKSSVHRILQKMQDLLREQMQKVRS